MAAPAADHGSRLQPERKVETRPRPPATMTSRPTLDVEPEVEDGLEAGDDRRRNHRRTCHDTSNRQRQPGRSGRPRLPRFGVVRVPQGAACDAETRWRQRRRVEGGRARRTAGGRGAPTHAGGQWTRAGPGRSRRSCGPPPADRHPAPRRSTRVRPAVVAADLRPSSSASPATGPRRASVRASTRPAAPEGRATRRRRSGRRRAGARGHRSGAARPRRPGPGTRRGRRRTPAGSARATTPAATTGRAGARAPPAATSSSSGQVRRPSAARRVTVVELVEQPPPRRRLNVLQERAVRRGVPGARRLGRRRPR